MLGVAVPALEQSRARGAVRAQTKPGAWRERQGPGCVRVRVCVCVCARARACVRACVLVCLRAYHAMHVCVAGRRVRIGRLVRRCCGRHVGAHHDARQPPRARLCLAARLLLVRKMSVGTEHACGVGAR